MCTLDSPERRPRESRTKQQSQQATRNRNERKSHPLPHSCRSRNTRRCCRTPRCDSAAEQQRRRLRHGDAFLTAFFFRRVELTFLTLSCCHDSPSRVEAALRARIVLGLAY